MRRWTSASKRERSRSRAARARAISPETAALMFAYSPLSTSSGAKSKAASVKLTLCLRTPIILSVGTTLEHHTIPRPRFQSREAADSLRVRDER